jgi:Outer membrane efflux protein
MTPECKCNIPPGLCHQGVVRTPVLSVVRKMSSHPVSLSRLFFAPSLVLATIAGCSSKEEKPAPPPLGITVTAVGQKDVPIHPLSELTAAGRAWSRAGNLAGPLSTAGRLKNEYRAALAQRDQANITFEKSGTQAFGEVSTSLSAHQELAEAYAEQLNSVVAYREPVRLSSIQYDSGLASYLEIIDAEIQMYSAERSAIIYDLGRKEALVNLYRALGAVAGT